MTAPARERRPGMVTRDGDATRCDASILPVRPLVAADFDASTAHEFGVGFSAAAIAAANRRVLASMGENLELLLQQAARRFVEDTLQSALPATWLRRAEQFEQVGSESADAAAHQCRRHAWILASAESLAGDLSAEVAGFFGGGGHDGE